MNKKLYFAGVGIMLLLGACTRYTTERTIIEAGGSREITLQEPKSRDMVTCRNSVGESAENCARMFEMSGYVRVTDIPQQIAKYDLTKPTTYPTRKWRNGEQNPRW